MAGYLPDEATADAFADGWYRTGDVGWLEPEGWVHLTDRSKEMIKVNGFQVAPAEVEAVLLRHPAVLDCAVFGVADERAGEVPVAAVQLDPDRHGGRRRAPGPSGRSPWPPTSTSATWSSSTTSRASPRARCCAGRSATSGRTATDRRSGRRLMDVRFSPEQQALRRRGGPGRRPARPPRRRADLGDPERTAKLDAAVRRSGWRELRTAGRRRRTAGVGGGGGRSSPRSWAGAWPTCRSSGRSLAGRAPPAGRRRAGADASRPWPSPPTSRSVARAGERTPGRRRWPSTRGVRPGHCSWCPRPRRSRLVAVELPPMPVGRRPDPPLAWSSTARWWPTRRGRRRGHSPRDDLARWTALGLALACADLVGTMAGAVAPGRATTPPSASSTAPPSARSRPSSTCWPTPTC